MSIGASREAVALEGPVLVIGAGLIGGSIGMALGHAGLDVLVRDSSPGTTRLACELGVGREVREGDEPQMIIVATPPDVCASVALDALQEFPEACVLDVASVKQPIAQGVLDGAAARGLDASRYVGTHPMAGREMAGVVAARGDLFRGRAFVVVPTPATSPRSFALARLLGVELGATVVEIEPDVHDEAVAYVSHVPQIVSSVLASRLTAASEAALGLSGQGLRDTTRIAASDPRLWVEILSANAGRIAPILKALGEDLDGLTRAFEMLGDMEPQPGSRACIARAIAAGNDGVARIPGKHGGGAESFCRVTVLVPDEPGELARLLTHMGEENINLEDLRLEHSLGQRMGLAHVSVTRADEPRLTAMLEKRGWARAGTE